MAVSDESPRSPGGTRLGRRITKMRLARQRLARRKSAPGAGPCRVMVLSASSGAGHVRAAEALVRQCEAHPEIGAVTHVDALSYTNKLFRRFYANLYIHMVRSAPNLWGWFFEASDEPWKTERMRLMLDRPNMHRLVNLVRAQRPHVVVCTHFLPAEIISHLLQKGRIDTALSIVVTDFYVHAMWLCRRYSRYFVAHEECRVQLEELGFPGDSITVSGIPIDPAFGATADRDALRARHGLDPRLPVVLISAGAFGVGPAAEMVKVLSRLRVPAQVAVICGRNEELQAEVSAFAAAQGSAMPRYHVMGYTEAMHEWMALADVLVSKPGGLTISEAMASRLPMVVLEPIPGQEDHNSDYLLENGAAVKCSDVTVLAHKVDRLLADPGRLAAMRAVAERLARPDAASLIVNSFLGERLARDRGGAPPFAAGPAVARSAAAGGSRVQPSPAR